MKTHSERLLFRSREGGIGIVLVNICWFVLGNVYRFNGRSIKRLQYRSRDGYWFILANVRCEDQSLERFILFFCLLEKLV